MNSTIIPATWKIPTAIRNRLGSTVGRQRLMSADGHLLLVLHGAPKPDEPDRQGRFFWRNPAGEWVSKDLGTGIRSLKTHVDGYEETIQRLDRAEEQATTVDEYFRVLDHLAPVHRAARNMYNVLEEARKICPEDRDLINVRDRAYAIQRNAELLYQETKNSLDYAMAKRGEQQARSSYRMEVAAHRLNMLVAFFFPVATLTAIFGVNLKHGYEERFVPHLFLGTIGLGLVLGVLLAAFVARRPRPPRDTGANPGRVV